MGASKGLGLTIDLRGGYSLANGTAATAADGTASTDTAATAVTYKSSNSYALGGGATIGFDIANNLALAGSFDFRSFQTREWTTTSTAGTKTVSQQKWNNMVIGLGLQPHVAALGGEIYGGGGVALILPYETTLTTTQTPVTGTGATQVTVAGLNMAIGGYGEVGYRFMFTDMIGLNIGARLVVATTNNIDKTQVRTTTTAAGTSTATTTYKESYSTGQNTAEAATGTATATRALAAWSTTGITDITGTVGISLRF